MALLGGQQLLGLGIDATGNGRLTWVARYGRLCPWWPGAAGPGLGSMSPATAVCGPRCPAWLGIDVAHGRRAGDVPRKRPFVVDGQRRPLIASLREITKKVLTGYLTLTLLLGELVKTRPFPGYQVQQLGIDVASPIRTSSGTEVSHGS